MSKTLCRMIGIIMMIISVFPLYAGMMLGSIADAVPSGGSEVLWVLKPWMIISGLALLATGIVFFKILKTDEG